MDGEQDGEGPTRDVMQQLSVYRKSLRGPPKPTREHMVHSLALLGVTAQAWEQWSSANLLQLLNRRIRDVFSKRMRRPEIVSLVKYLRRRHGPVNNQIKHLAIPESVMRVQGTRPVPKSDDADFAQLQPGPFNRASAKGDNPWIQYYRKNVAQAKAFHPNMSHPDIMRLMGDAYTGTTREVVGSKGRFAPRRQPKSGESTVRGRVAKQKQVKARKRVVKKENKEFIELQDEISNPSVPTLRAREERRVEIADEMDEQLLAQVGDAEYMQMKQEETEQLARRDAVPELAPRRRFKGAYGEGWAI